MHIFVSLAGAQISTSSIISPEESPTALPQKPRCRARLAYGEAQRTVAAFRGKPRPRHSSANHLRWRTQPLGHGSPPFRRDTEIRGNALEWLELETLATSFKPLSVAFSVPQSGLPCRLEAMQRIAEAWPRADAGLLENLPTARRRGAARAANRFRGRPQGLRHKLSEFDHSRGAQAED